MDTAIVKEVIVTSLLRRGDGTPESPCRIITQYWDKDGTMLAEVDPLPICEENRPIIRERNALRARVVELETGIEELKDLKREDEDMLIRVRDKAQCEADRFAVLNRKYLRAIKWALGEKGDFLPPTPKNGPVSPYWWRTKLRELAGFKK